MRKYRVVYIYAPYPNKEFKRLEDAIEFSKNEIPATKIQTKTIFGKWKDFEKKVLTNQ